MEERLDKSQSQESEFYSIDIVRIFVKYNRVIILTGFAVMVIIYLILFITPNVYTATSRILPPQQNMTMSAQILDTLLGSSATNKTGSGLIGGMAASLLGFKSPADLYVGMLTSNTVFDQIIERFKLKKDFKVKFIEDARAGLRKITKIGVNKKDGIIVVEATTKSPEKSAEIANAFVEELDLLLQKIAHREAKEQVRFLEKERSQTSQNLIKAEEALRNFSEQKGVLQIDTQTKGVLEYIARLRAEIDSKEVAIEVLRQQATPYNYDVVRLETEAKGLKEKLRTAETQYGNCVSDVCIPTNKTPELALEYVRLFREAKFQQSLYELYLKLLEIARLDMVRDNAVIQVVDMATPPEKRSNTRLFKAISWGAATSLIVFFIITVRVYFQNLRYTKDGPQHLELITEFVSPWQELWNRIRNKLLFKRKI